MLDLPSKSSALSSAICVVRVEDHLDLSDRLSGLLNEPDGYAYVGSYGSIEQAVIQIRAVLGTETAINAVCWSSNCRDSKTNTA